MKKKLFAIIGVVLAVWILFTGYNQFFGPEINPGEKTVTLTIINEKTGENRETTLVSEGDTLYDLLVENEEEFLVVLEEYDFGHMVEGLLGYQATVENQEYFHLTVNGEDAMTGPEGIPLAQGDEYQYSLRNYGDFSASEPTQEDKTVTLEIYNEKTGMEFSQELKTRAESLHDLLMTVEESAGVVLRDKDSETEIAGFLGYVPEAEEYFHILIDGEDAKAGLKTIPLLEGGTYRLELRRFDGTVPVATAEEEKTITFKVVNQEAAIDFSMSATTELGTLLDWLQENAETLDLVMVEYDFGFVVTSLLGVETKEVEQEYYHLTIDGEDAMTGPGQIQLKDGGVYLYEMRTY